MQPNDRGDEDSRSLTPQAKLGLALFAVYVLLYGGFILFAVVDLPLLASPSFAGVNYATWYGFFLIGSAIALSLVYMFLSGHEGEESRGDE